MWTEILGKVHEGAPGRMDRRGGEGISDGEEHMQRHRI